MICCRRYVCLSVVLAGAWLLSIEATFADDFFDGYLEIENVDGEPGLDGSNGFFLFGLNQSDNLGYSVGGAGDINGDGLPDLVVGAPSVNVDGVTSAGAAYVLFCSTSSFPTSFDLSSLDGVNGFVLTGGVERESLGIAVNGAGDLNDDGLDDLVVGAIGTGRSYVVFGSQSPFPAAIAASSVTGARGFTLSGGGSSGGAVSGLGDVNGDQVDDLLIGSIDSRFADTYVAFGSKTGFPAEVQLQSLDGTTGFRIDAIEQSDGLGWSVSRAGDVNGDGLADMIVGAPDGFRAGRGFGGESYVVFGSLDGFPAALDVGTLDGSNGFALLGREEAGQNGYSGWSVAGGGDFNGDGLADLLVGAPYVSDFVGTFDVRGATYLVFGSTTGFPAAIDLATLDGTDGFKVIGDCGIFPEDCSSKDTSGKAASFAGDLNGDGFDDIVIGASGDTSFTAEAYVLFGHAGEFPAEFLVGSNDPFLAGEPGFPPVFNGQNGFAIEGDAGTSNTQDIAVSGIGDFNGDGIDDFVIGQPGYSRSGGPFSIGRISIIFGAKTVPVPEPQSVVLVSLFVVPWLLTRASTRLI